MVVAEYLKLRHDLGDAQRAWGILWKDVYEARGDLAHIWEEPFATSPYPSKRLRARIRRVERVIRSAFPGGPFGDQFDLPESWDGLTSTSLQEYAPALGSAMISQMLSPLSIVEKLMLIPHQVSILDDLMPTSGSGRPTAEKVRDCTLSLSSDQRMGVAEYLQLRCELGDRPAQQAWTCLWRDIDEAGGDMSLVWFSPIGGDDEVCAP